MFSSTTKISGNIVDVIHSKIYPGTLEIANGKIIAITKDYREYDRYLIPGLVDAHVHIESSMMVPSEFARLAVTHGTVATVSDPHEIANILGIDGVCYMITNGKKVSFKFYFGAPSCVPATGFETSGAIISAGQIEELFRDEDLKFLSEMMNFPGVLSDDPVVMAKIKVALEYGRPIDGHAPGLTGKELEKYIQAGISTDHEAFQWDEGLAKVRAGMKILIREGTAAKNFAELHGLVTDFSDSCMFCCDDKHPNDLVNGHLNTIIKMALDLGYDKFKVLKCATVNPVLHYGLDVGLLQLGDPADLVVIDNFSDFHILETYINGKLVAKDGQSLLKRVKPAIINNFKAKPKQPTDFAVQRQSGKLNVIEVTDGELVTKKIKVTPKVMGEFVVSDPECDILKIAVVNRYHDAPPAVAFIKNFGLKKGAIASSVAHDSHNIVVVGVSDHDIAGAVNLVIKHRGGLAVAYENTHEVLPLPVAGLMGIDDGYLIADHYTRIAEHTKALGATLKDPYMTMSFMTLLVIPDLKISDKGLFDGVSFRFTDLFED